MKRALELAAVDALVERARAKTAELLQAARRRRRKWKRPAGPFKSKLERSLERRRQRILRGWKRDRAADESTADLQMQDGLVRWDAFTLGLKAESKAARHQKDCRVRALLAAKLRAVAQAFGRTDVDARAERLEKAGRSGWWGVRELDGSIVVRLRDRSGLIMLDPTEARERTAELTERLLPLLLECARNGLQLYKAVFSEPNIVAGSLPWGKEHIFSEFLRRILERDRKGQEIPRTLPVKHGGRWLEVPNPARKLPEIVAAFAVQEDPLAADERHWNTHLNVILVVDPGQCAPLAREDWPTDPETGKPKRDPAADVGGMFSFMKLRHVWGSAHQVEIRWLEPTTAALRRQLLEVIKYSCKTVSEKSLEKFEAARTAHAESGDVTLSDGNTSSENRAPPALELLCQDAQDAPAEIARPPAPAMIDWPDARVLEWLDANRGFRRVRSWGCLYRLGKLPRATDPDEGIRWMGRISITPWRIIVQSDFIGRGDSFPVDSIQENKSPSGGPLPRAQSPP